MKIITDRNEALIAIKQNSLNFHYISEELQNDREIVIETVRTASYTLQCISKELQIVIEMAKKYSNALEYASDKLRVVLKVVRQNGGALQNDTEYASWELRGDKEFILEAINQGYLALEYASKKLQKYMITEKRLSFLEERASNSKNFAELVEFLEIEKNYPEVETTEDRERIKGYAKKRIQELAKINNVK